MQELGSALINTINHDVLIGEHYESQGFYVI